MNARFLAQQVLPAPLYRLGRQGYGYVRQNWLATVVACSTSQKIVGLTFDDGPSEYTPQILAVLNRYRVKATFFLLGKNVAAHPDTARAILQGGHAVGNHTFSHPRLSEINPLQVISELRQCQKTIQEVVGTKTRTMRPPQGAQSLSSFLITRMMGYTTVHWSASGDDWQGDPAIVVAERVLRKVKPGAIILLHDGLEPLAVNGDPEYQRLRDRAPTIAALERIIQQLQGEGYRFATVPQLLQIKPLIKKVWFV